MVVELKKVKTRIVEGNGAPTTRQTKPAGRQIAPAGQVSAQSPATQPTQTAAAPIVAPPVAPPRTEDIILAPKQKEAWITYLTGRSRLSPEQIKMLVESPGKTYEVKEKEGKLELIVTTEKNGNNQVFLVNGLSFNELRLLGVETSEIENIIARGFKLENEEGSQTGQAALIIDPSDILAFSKTVKEYAEAQGINDDEAAKLYLNNAAEFERIDLGKVKTERETAEKEIDKQYDVWKKTKGNENKAIAEFLQIDSKHELYRVGNRLKTGKDIVRQAFIATLKPQDQTKIFNKEAAFSMPFAASYSAENVKNWVTSFISSQSELAGTAEKPKRSKARRAGKYKMKREKKQFLKSASDQATKKAPAVSARPDTALTEKKKKEKADALVSRALDLVADIKGERDQGKKTEKNSALLSMLPELNRILREYGDEDSKLKQRIQSIANFIQQEVD